MAAGLANWHFKGLKFVSQNEVLNWQILSKNLNYVSARTRKHTNNCRLLCQEIAQIFKRNLPLQNIIQIFPTHIQMSQHYRDI